MNNLIDVDNDNQWKHDCKFVIYKNMDDASKYLISS